MFADVGGTRSRLLDLSASAGADTAHMGDELHAAAGSPVHVDAHVVQAAGEELHVLLDGKALAPSVDTPLRDTDQHVRFDRTSDGRRHWLRAEVRDAHGKPLLIDNPVYLEVTRR